MQSGDLWKNFQYGSYQCITCRNVKHIPVFKALFQGKMKFTCLINAQKPFKHEDYKGGTFQKFNNNEVQL